MSARLQGIAPWTALIAAAAGWALHQQLVAQTLHFDCHATAGGAGLAWGLFSLAIVFAGTAVSWRARPGAQDASALAAVRRFAVYLGLMGAMLATLGIVFQILAVALLPGCRP
jgi:hypothetical protein